jgi:hypothetical protein
MGILPPPTDNGLGLLRLEVFIVVMIGMCNLLVAWVAWKNRRWIRARWGKLSAGRPRHLSSAGG